MKIATASPAEFNDAPLLFPPSIDSKSTTNIRGRSKNSRVTLNNFSPTNAKISARKADSIKAFALAFPEKEVVLIRKKEIPTTRENTKRSELSVPKLIEFNGSMI